MSNTNAYRVYRDSRADYTAWLLERILEDRAETAPLPPEFRESGDE